MRTSRFVRMAAAAALLVPLLASPAVAETGSSAAQPVDSYGRPLVVDSRAIQATWSPDGKYLAYTQSVGDNASELHLLDLSSGESKLLVPVKKPVDHWKLKVGQWFTEVAFNSPQFSPDGRFLSYQEVATRYRLMDSLGSLNLGPWAYRHTVIRDLETGATMVLDTAAKLKSSSDFFWAADSKSGYLQASTKGGYGQLLPRRIKFQFLTKRAIAAKGWLVGRTSVNGKFAAMQQAYRSQVYIVNTTTGAKVGKLTGACRYDAGCVQFISADGSAYWRQIDDWSTNTCQLYKQDSRTSAVLSQTATSCAKAISTDDSKFLVKSADGFAIVPAGSLALPTLTACPKTRAEAPDVYDACWKYFAPPSVQLLGKPDCRINSESGVNVIAQWQLVGGNYRSIRWSSTTTGWWYAAHPGDSFPLMETFTLYVSPWPGYTGEMAVEIEGDGWVTLDNCHA